MNKQADYVLRTVEERGIRFVRLWFTDVQGFLKSVAISPAELEVAFEEGMTFDGSAIDGYARVQEADMLARPDPSTFAVLPWRTEQQVARMFCDIITPDGEPFDGDPRTVLKRNLDRAADMGYTFYAAPELEFFYFEDAGPNPEVLDRGGYFDLTPLDVAQEYRRRTIMVLESLGIPVELSHHEVAPSQHELDLRYTDALTMADSLMTTRLAVKEVALENGIHATFMPKPLVGDNGNGMHVHQSLSKGGDNLFSGDGYGGLSETALYYIGGIIRHAKAINAYTNPATNSYKRLVPGFEAPTILAYSARNRSASIRIPYVANPKARRVEVRFPDSMANPYLAFSAMLMAGLDGIQNKIHPGDAMDKDLYDLPPEEEKELQLVAFSLDEALAALDGDRDFLKAGDVFSDDLIDAYIELKMENVARLRMTTHPVEFDMYYSL